MNGLPYYKAYPRDFIEGTIGMDFETKAAYRLVLDLIYMQGGNLPDDPRYISGLLGCSVKKWNSIRRTLVDTGKIDVRGAYLGNYRADKELEILGSFQEKQRKNRSNPNKNNDIESPPSNHTESDTESYNPPLPPVVDVPVTTTVERPDALAPDEIARIELIDLRKGIVAAFRDAGSMTLAPDTHRAERWVAQGYKPAVILAVVREVLVKHPHVKSLSYFDNPIQEAHDKAAKQTAVLQPVDEGKRLNYLRGMVREWQREPTSWPSRLGPRPDDPSCNVPGNILAEFNIQARDRRAA